MSLPNLPKS